MNQAKNNIENTEKELAALKKLMAKKPEQLELPLENPNDNIILFPVPENSPINNWYKANVKKFKNKNFASADELGPYLTEFYSEKQLRNMTEKDLIKALDELLEAGVL